MGIFSLKEVVFLKYLNNSNIVVFCNSGIGIFLMLIQKLKVLNYMGETDQTRAILSSKYDCKYYTVKNIKHQSDSNFCFNNKSIHLLKQCMLMSFFIGEFLI